jgi:hypothetical protein
LQVLDSFFYDRLVWPHAPDSTLLFSAARVHQLPLISARV